MKRFLAVFLASTTLFTASVFADGMRYVYNNDEVDIQAEAIFKDGIVYLPVAQVCKALGYKVIEKESNNSVTAEVKTKPGYFSVFLGKSKGRMNGQDIGLAKAPFNENGVIYVTAGLIEDQLGVSVNYDSSKNTIYFTSKGEGKITSTVGQAPASKPVAKSSTASASSVSSASTYPGTNIPTFTSVTGEVPNKTAEHGAQYSTQIEKIDQYRTYLENNGFKPYKSQSNMWTKDGYIVFWDYRTYLENADPVAGSSYFNGNPNSVTTPKGNKDCTLVVNFSTLDYFIKAYGG